MTNIQHLVGTYLPISGSQRPALVIKSIDDPVNAIGNVVAEWKDNIMTSISGRSPETFAALNYQMTGLFVYNNYKLYMSLCGQNSIPNPNSVKDPTWLSAAVSLTLYSDDVINPGQTLFTGAATYAQVSQGNGSSTYANTLALRK